MKVATIVGARPQFIKAATVSRAIRARGGLEETMIHTGQHFDAAMSDIFFEELDIPLPERNLAIQSGGHGQMTGRMLEALEHALIELQPQLVMVYGDTNSTLAGALAAAKLHIPIAHVEAGLRSFNRRMPEEINRVVTDHVASLHFCPTRTAVANLAREGVIENVFHAGDVMCDATLYAIARADRSTILARLGLEQGGYAVATVHRAESTDDPAAMRAIFSYLAKAAGERPVVLPLHPRTRKALDQAGLVPDGIILTEPLGYLDLQALLAGSELVLTDSGGVQKEAYFHRKPCITLRSETEWVETVENGWNRLWNGPDFATPRRDIADYGDGRAADAIVAKIAEFG